ncbi:WD repeat-containing protein GTS1-like isoform X2 [Actinidia eriantha]|uniref:WD repeat-containing protein GTS1-like isoform X2 n=1 Tax=Actinidia eriantha TaxID=165200 RepID=UPI002589688C|nr:WD repeat-containing protein GTS1-like isoform X2 [Actinidia eriantha]
MEAMAMEVEEARPSFSTNSFKRFGLKNSIQTNFGDDYVFQIVPKDDWALMAVSLSTNAVKLYSPVTGQYFGECNGHSSTINQIAFSGPTNPNILHSCSSDGSIRAWDTRSFHQVSCVSASPSQEVFCFSFGGSGDNLLAAGSKSQISFWDWRNKKQIACLEESHMDDVTQVHFVPDHQNKLVSASVDGLMCIFDTGGNINNDDHLESVINVGTSIGKVGFFGEASRKLWCLTHIETLSVWDWKDARIEVNFEDARSLASDRWSLDHVDYFVDCHYSGEDNLWLIGGTSAGTLGYFPVDCRDKGTIGSPEAVLHGGHMGIVRSMLPMSHVHGGPSHSGGIFGWTGGEDGRLCCWLSDESSDANCSWISTELVMKPPKARRKSRHHPY